jgi:predicted metal-dependent hydrolase
MVQPLPIDATTREQRQVWLAAQLAARVRIVWTDNRTVMLSVRDASPAGYHMRLHHMFRQAPDDVWQSLVAYIRDADAAAQRLLRAYIRHHQHLIRQPPQPQRRPRVLRTQGHHFDLEAIYRELNQTYFGNRVRARITWSRQPPKRPRTSIRFGSYHAGDRLIRIHRLLDQPFVPGYVIENVVFHEMLHQLIPRRHLNGRWCIHPPEFRQQEQQFPHHQRAEEWKRRHLNRLLHG